MERKKELADEYKRRSQCGGIYKITNTANGKYLMGCAPDLNGMKNRFEFSVATGSCVHLKLQKDWKEFGSKAFSFEILESLEKKETQTSGEFMEDLKTLEKMWIDRYDKEKSY